MQALGNSERCDGKSINFGLRAHGLGISGKALDGTINVSSVFFATVKMLGSLSAFRYKIRLHFC